jgi:hypothetical protein
MHQADVRAPGYRKSELQVTQRELDRNPAALRDWTRITA